MSTIPGNHDCDLTAISHQAKIVYAQFRESTPEEVQANLNGISLDGEASNPFLPKLHAYREFARGYGCDFESPAHPFWIRSFDLPGGIKIKFHGFTSVQVSDLTDKVGNIVLGNQQYTISEEPNVVNVVLVHHPLDWFIDKTEALQHLQNSARVIMVGHEHALNIQKTTDGFTQKSGSSFTREPRTRPRRITTTLTIGWSFRVKKMGHQCLVVEVFPRVWVQEGVRFDADRTRLGSSAESIRIEISCPNLQPKVEQEDLQAPLPRPRHKLLAQLPVML